MKRNNSLKYFRASLDCWFKKSGLRQYQAAMLFEVSQSLITKFLRGESGLSFAQADNIANKLNKDVAAMIEEGRELIEGKVEDKNDNSYTDSQKEAIEAFKAVLLYGGEAAELLAENAIRLAEKKKIEAEYQHPYQQSKSA